MSDSGRVLRYANLRLRLVAGAEVIEGVERELGPFFSTDEHDGVEDASPLATLWVRAGPFPMERRPTGDPDPVVVDASLYRHLASRGQRWGSETTYVIHVDVTDTWVTFDKPAREVCLYQPDPSRAVLETVRLAKGIVTPALERSGAVQLHGSGAVGGGEAVLILADMWHGKTTLLLEMLSEFDVAQLSCDTVVLSNGAQGVEISGWPSPFSVSHGTQSDFPQLYPWFPESRRSVEYGRLWEERQKSVLSSADVVAAFGTCLEPKCERLGACFLAEFAPDKPTALERVRDAAEIEAFLHRVCLGSRDPIYLNWHGFVTCDAATIDGSLRAWAAWLSTRETYRLTWAPSAVSLMKRVRRVGRLHKDLRRLLEVPTE